MKVENASNPKRIRGKLGLVFVALLLLTVFVGIYVSVEPAVTISQARADAQQAAQVIGSCGLNGTQVASGAISEMQNFLSGLTSPGYHINSETFSAFEFSVTNSSLVVSNLNASLDYTETTTFAQASATFANGTWYPNSNHTAETDTYHDRFSISVGWFSLTSNSTAMIADLSQFSVHVDSMEWIYANSTLVAVHHTLISNSIAAATLETSCE